MITGPTYIIFCCPRFTEDICDARKYTSCPQEKQKMALWYIDAFNILSCVFCVL